MALRFTKYGMRELKLFSALSGALLVVVIALVSLIHAPFGFKALVVLPFIGLLVLVIMFFRDPDRVVPKGEHRLVSPADGTIYDIGEVDENIYLNERALRIGIFLSVFNVHINRVPCSGVVEKIVYKRGQFVSALKAAECSRSNESNFIGIGNVAGRGFKVGVRQIAGQIARRIVCKLKEGDPVEKGQQFGMIKFGSRTELFIPKSVAFKLKVQLGQTVQAGTTIIATLEDAPEAAAETRK